MPDPQEGDQGVKRFLLSWSPDGRSWQALDLTDPNQAGFEDNEVRGTAQVKNLMRSRAEISRQLKEDGVFIEGGRLRQILAMDFERAYKSFSIQPLP